jgi:hypothetical protein
VKNSVISATDKKMHRICYLTSGLTAIIRESEKQLLLVNGCVNVQ